MNKLLTGSIAAIAMVVAVPALAADLAPRYTKAPPPAPVMVYNWTGCYIGGNVGGGWGRIRENRTDVVLGTTVVPAAADFGSSEGTGVIGGAQIGCDYQFAGNFVVGIQGMFDFSDIRSTHTITAFPTFFSENRTKDVFTVTGRVGYLFAPQVLGYVKGGGAWARIDTNHFVSGPPVSLSEFATGQNRQGWTVGGGLEWMFAPGWSVFGEYNYMDFGRKSVGFTSAIAGPLAANSAPSIVSTRFEVQQALVGVNYKFNWGGPVVAKY
ncbi:MAG TPA: outer membrane beta-barrel protein [Bradyrhizobium sp.]|nr:outer membrane beta-barrel protein [Bradyrhizobium sp.]